MRCLQELLIAVLYRCHPMLNTSLYGEFLLGKVSKEAFELLVMPMGQSTLSTPLGEEESKAKRRRVSRGPSSRGTGTAAVNFCDGQKQKFMHTVKREGLKKDYEHERWGDFILAAVYGGLEGVGTDEIDIKLTRQGLQWALEYQLNQKVEIHGQLYTTCSKVLKAIFEAMVTGHMETLVQLHNSKDGVAKFMQTKAFSLLPSPSAAGAGPGGSADLTNELKVPEIAAMLEALIDDQNWTFQLMEFIEHCNKVVAAPRFTDLFASLLKATMEACKAPTGNLDVKIDIVALLSIVDKCVRPALHDRWCVFIALAHRAVDG